MHNHPLPFPAVENRFEKLGCYSGLHEAEAQVFFPKDEGELRQVFEYATENGCGVTLRGGAHSFDAQSLGDDLVISMMHFDEIQVEPQNNLVHVGPGARWGHILEALASFGLMAASTVTTSDATAGGTLAGDCLSRFSPAYGKEGVNVRGFEMMSVNGVNRAYLAPGKNVPPINWTPEQHVFAGVVGGLGYLGAVTSITYEVLPVHGPRPARVTTTVRKYKSLDRLAEDLVKATAEMDTQRSDPNDAALSDSIYSALYAGRRGRKTALLFTSRVVAGRKRKRLLFHWPRFFLRVPAEWLMRTRFGAWLLWRGFYGTVSQKNEHYADDLPDYTFFMDGNVRAKAAGKWLGAKMQTIQQTFIVPSDPSAAGWEKSKDDLAWWLDYTSRYFAERKLTPTMFDVMWLPRDHLFPLSATADMAGFAVSYAFETSSKRKLPRIMDCFVELSDLLWNRFRGRVYLVKNVHANEQTLQNMYGQNAIAFFELKHQLDPGCVLRNEFLERTFPELLQQYCPHLTAPTPPARVSRTAVP